MMEWSAKIVCSGCGKKADVEIVGEHDLDYTRCAGEEDTKGIVVGVEYMRPATWSNREYCSARCALSAQRDWAAERLAGIEAALAAEETA
jgi:endogenous inhibitor of DNA gyrase (YacG/DUF329 family)